MLDNILMTAKIMGELWVGTMPITQIDMGVELECTAGNLRTKICNKMG
jgi:hypothetical protein